MDREGGFGSMIQLLELPAAKEGEKEAGVSNLLLLFLLLLLLVLFPSPFNMPFAPIFLPL